ncbi:DUF4229 domain-containing protein [Nocardiopsis kunsanensis]|uniref:DUF4229 domain-containing protein n=1 Tax=Nocardiopsis kunsanensis TaxID=141693 RepID=A0A919CI61_9ACTN|nr:DUF4229 domain-containing protein [Nocardiopsis kunsanensis]GHD27842.1 hypothetical protein GCM10007147_27250 [Nocardiopsis kunsanensis]
MRSWLTYTAARLGLFAAAFGVVYLFGARSWIALVLAWVVSGLASYVLLSKWRDRISQQIVDRDKARRGVRLGDRLDGGASREDHLQDAAEESQSSQEASSENTPGKSAEEGRGAPEESAEESQDAQEGAPEGGAVPQADQEPAAADGDEPARAETKGS